MPAAMAASSSALPRRYPATMPVLLNRSAVRVDAKQMQPAVAHQMAHHIMLAHHVVDGGLRCLDEHAQPQRGMAQGVAVVQ